MIHDSLKDFFEDTDVTERQLREKLGISKSYMNQLKHGERRPSAHLALHIEEITGVPFKELLFAEREQATDQNDQKEVA